MEDLDPIKLFFNRIYYFLFIERFNKKLSFNFPSHIFRWDLIQHIINKYNYTDYLEIGCDKDQSFSKIKINNKQYFKMIIYKHKTFKYFIKFLEEIDENLGSIKMMIRPHPRENIDDWKKITNKFKNIYVVAPIDDVTSYILASKGVMHNGCSTGISSLLLGKSTAYFYEKSNSSYKDFIQNDMLKSSIEVGNIRDFYKWLTSLEKNSNNHVKKNDYYKNFKKQELSCKIILDDLNKDAINRESKIETLKVIKRSKFFYVIKYLLSTKFLNFFKEPITIDPQIKIPNGNKKKEIEKYLREFKKINGLKKK